MAEPSVPLTESGYRLTLDLVINAAQILVPLPLDRVLGTIDQADSIGPVIYPSEYQRAVYSGSLQTQRQLVEAAIAFRKVLEDAVERLDPPTPGETP